MGFYGNWYSTSCNIVSQVLCAKYKCNPITFKKNGRCLESFSVSHALIFSNIGLIIAHHNEICDKIIHLTRQAFYPNCARVEPLTHEGSSISEGGISWRENSRNTA